MLSQKIVVKNSLVGIAGHMVTMVLGFVIQRYFLHCLGLEILGIHGVIADALGFLSLAELGVGNAIVFRLYKPLVDNNEDEISSLMKLYSTLYRIIGVVVFVVGNIVVFFLPFLMKETTVSFSIIYIAYYIQLITVSSTYFFSYKRSLLYADQKQYICKIIDLICNVTFCLIRLLILIVWKNYLAYLTAMLVQSVLSNFIVSLYCDKLYPYLKNKYVKKYANVKDIFVDTKDILFGKIAGYIYNATDSMVISSILGVTNVGSLSNYKSVTNSIKNLMSSMTDSIMATIGNFVNVKDNKEALTLLKRYTFARFVISNVAALGMIICIDSFVAIVYGPQYLMKCTIPILIVIDIFIGVIYGPLGEFDNVLGYFSYEKWIHFCGAFMNIVTSIVLAHLIGIPGVLIGTVISQIFFWIAKSILLCRKYFQSMTVWLELWKRYFSFIVVEVVEILLCMWILHFIQFGQMYLLRFVVEVILCLVVAMVCIILCYARTDEYRYFVAMVKKLKK